MTDQTDQTEQTDQTGRLANLTRSGRRPADRCAFGRLLLAVAAALTLLALGLPTAQAVTAQTDAAAVSSTGRSVAAQQAQVERPGRAAGGGLAMRQVGGVAAAGAVAGKCWGPDALCGVGDAIGDVWTCTHGNVSSCGEVASGAAPAAETLANPFETVGNLVSEAIADAWTRAMLAVWGAGLFVFRVVLWLGELFLTPQVGAGGPGRVVYEYMLWLAGALVVVLLVAQLGLAAFRRDGKGLARAVIGTGQFVVVCAVWFGYCALVVAGSSELTRALMKALLNVNHWPDWDPFGDTVVQAGAGAGVATVLGLLGLVLFVCGLGHLLIYMARGASLLVLVATGPVAAAGLVAELGRSWFWKTLRWFHAAALTPVLMVMVMGIGIQFANAVAAGVADGTVKTISTAICAVMLILIATVAPLALFKLLAFVDPASPSGASFRQGLALSNSVAGLLGGGGGAGGGSSTASQADSTGKSAGESSAEATAASRFGAMGKGAVGGNLPGSPVQLLSQGVGGVQSLGGKATSLLSDGTNQAGVGHALYGPDFSDIPRGGSGGGYGDPAKGDLYGDGPDSQGPHGAGPDGAGPDGSGPDGGDGGGGDSGDSRIPSPEPAWPAMAPPAGPAVGTGPAAGVPGGGPGGGAAGAAAEVPPVPPV